jgi:hypothetical protein
MYVICDEHSPLLYTLRQQHAVLLTNANHCSPKWRSSLGNIRATQPRPSTATKSVFAACRGLFGRSDGAEQPALRVSLGYLDAMLLLLRRRRLWYSVPCAAAPAGQLLDGLAIATRPSEADGPRLSSFRKQPVPSSAAVCETSCASLRSQSRHGKAGRWASAGRRPREPSWARTG